MWAIPVVRPETNVLAAESLMLVLSVRAGLGRLDQAHRQCHERGLLVANVRKLD
jgi:hypothetical protein